MEVYCVKEKKFTPNVPGSEKTGKTKNGRPLLKVKCASCGITKTRFISSQEGAGVFSSALSKGKDLYKMGKDIGEETGAFSAMSAISRAKNLYDIGKELAEGKPGEAAHIALKSEFPGIAVGEQIFKLIPGVDKKLFDNYWSGDIAKGAFNTKTGLFSKKFWTHPKNRDPSCDNVTFNKKTGKWVNHYCD